MPKDEFNLNKGKRWEEIDDSYGHYDPIITENDDLSFYTRRNYAPMMTQTVGLSFDHHEYKSLDPSEGSVKESPGDVIARLTKESPSRNIPIFNRYKLFKNNQPVQFGQPLKVQMPTYIFFESIINKVIDLNRYYHIDISEWSEEDLKKYNLKEYFDSSTFMLILNPVKLSCDCIVDGNERLKTWLADEPICPKCGKEVNPDAITVNNEVGKIIDERLGHIRLEHILNECHKVNNNTTDEPEPSASPSLHM